MATSKRFPTARRRANTAEGGTLPKEVPAGVPPVIVGDAVETHMKGPSRLVVIEVESYAPFSVRASDVNGYVGYVKEKEIHEVYRHGSMLWKRKE